MFRPFTDLNTGFYNAENYRLRQNKELLEQFFVRDVYLDHLLDPNIYFLVGEKGTGKTAYATYLANTIYKSRQASVFDIWPAPGSEDTKFGVTMGPEVAHGASEVYAGVQA